ncbi:MAG: RNA methyltransferase [Deltaproteobacteria bacterium]
MPENTGPVAASPRVILVRPRGGANVGAVCRAIKNMGGGCLVIVDGRFDLEQARRMAVHAADVLEARLEVDTLREAIEGTSVVVGTTARGGAYRCRSTDIHELVKEIVGGGGDDPSWALVFGPEDTGLSNQEVAVCHHLAVVPTAKEYSSLNLSQAVLLCLYEVWRRRLACSADDPADRQGQPMFEAADAGAVDDMCVALEKALVEIGFLSPSNPHPVMAALRSAFGRAHLDVRELSVLRGIARQISWFSLGGREIAHDKRSRGQRLR